MTDCVRGVELPHLHWVLTPGGAPVDGTSADLFINGKFVGTMTPVGDQGALQLTTTTGPFTLHKLSQSTVFAVVTSGSVGENAVLTISDGCVCPH